MSREPRRWVPAALGVSLLLNLLLVGIVSGRVFAAYDPMRQAAARSPTFAMRVRALPSDERARFEAAYEGHRKAVVAARQNLRAARLTALGALAAPIYDPAVMQSDFDALVHAVEVAQKTVDAGLVDAFAPLSVQSRAMLAGADRRQGN